MDKDNQKLAMGSGIRIINSAIILLCMVLIALSALFAYQNRTNLVNAEIDKRLSSLVQTTSETLRLSIENLQAASSILVYFDDISYAQFKGVAGSYFESDPALLIIEWQPVVLAKDREEFVRKAQRQGLVNFRLWEPDAEGNPVTAATREEHVPVYFMLSRNSDGSDQGTLGLDLAWSEQRMKSKWAARDLGRAQASGLFNVVTGPRAEPGPLGFAITLPIYRNGLVPASVDDRKSELLGYMAGIYSLERLLKPSLESLTYSGFNIEVHDKSDDSNRLNIQAGIASDYSNEIVLGFFGNSLHFKLIATDDYVSRQFKLSWIVLPLSIFIFTAVVLVFLYQLERKNHSLALAHSKLEEFNTELKTLAQTDPLTELLNRRAFISILDHHLERIRRHPEKLGLMLLDLDNFKSINDTWGHPVGDRVLVEFSNACRETSRSIDSIARIGGEEFGIMLVNTTRDEAMHFAQRLRERIMNLKIQVAESNTEISITVSIGLSVINSPISSQQWIEQADKALYLAKGSGRNCVKEYVE